MLKNPNYKVYNLPKISSLDNLPPVQKLVSKQHIHRQKLPTKNHSPDELKQKEKLNKFHSLSYIDSDKRKPSKIKTIQVQLENKKYLDT